MARKDADIRSIFSYLAPVFALALAATACGGGDGRENPAQGGGGSGATGDSCRTDALFTARTFGDLGDLIRHIVLDESNGDILFSVLDEIYVLRAGASAPEKLADRPDGSSPIGGSFTLRDGKLYFPAILSLEENGRLPVLYEMDRSGGAPRVTASMPADDPLDVFQMVRGSAIVGDELIWFDEYSVRDIQGVPNMSTYYARRTSFSSPGEPVVWFESPESISGAAISGTLAFINVDKTDRPADGSEQKIVDFSDGSVETITAEARYGGRVVAADESSLLVSVSDFSDLSRLEENGIFRVAPDGSGKARIARFGALNLGFGDVLNIAHKGDLWALDDFEPEDSRQGLYVYQVGSEPRRVGCVDDRYTIHAIAIGDGELLVSVFESSSNLATIFHFDL